VPRSLLSSVRRLLSRDLVGRWDSRWRRRCKDVALFYSSEKKNGYRLLE
jgi:hypothetical protein